MSDASLGRQAFIALNANAHLSVAAADPTPTYHAYVRESATGYVSESTLLSPPPVGPVCGSKFGHNSRCASCLANSAKAASWFRLVSVSRWYSSRPLSSAGEPSSFSESENCAGRRALRKARGDVGVVGRLGLTISPLDRRTCSGERLRLVLRNLTR